MRAPAFWSEPPGLLAGLLSPAGAVYGAITAWRMGRRGRRASVPVICVGNLTAGGAGKTPTVLMLVEALTRRGERPFVVSRGYGGRLRGPVRVRPESMTAADCGDEPLLLARAAPVIVSRHRAAGAGLAHAERATVVLLDDGLQNPGLEKDFTLAVVDVDVRFGNGYCLPAGPLRAPLARQVPHIDAFVAIGEGDRGFLSAWGKPVFGARLEPQSAAVEALSSLPLLAFAGIGRPEKFYATLRSAALNVAETRSFADHHPYSAMDLEALRERAGRDGLTLVTTEKDRVRLPPGSDDIRTLPVTLSTADETLVASVAAAIDRRRLEL